MKKIFALILSVFCLVSFSAVFMNCEKTKAGSASAEEAPAATVDATPVPVVTPPAPVVEAPMTEDSALDPMAEMSMDATPVVAPVVVPAPVDMK